MKWPNWLTRTKAKKEDEIELAQATQREAEVLCVVGFFQKSTQNQHATYSAITRKLGELRLEIEAGLLQSSLEAMTQKEWLVKCSVPDTEDFWQVTELGFRVFDEWVKFAKLVVNS